jgi:hypothetical protein
MKRVLTPLKAGTHTQNCEILDGGFYIYTLTWQVIELCTNCYLPTAVLLWPRQLQLKQNPNWPCHVWLGGGVVIICSSTSSWNLDEIWMKFGWSLDGFIQVCMFVCLFWVACFECFLSFFLSFSIAIRSKWNGCYIFPYFTYTTSVESSQVS